eukprot:TRINITY_DN5985_c0_g1_i3.p1 TRINITY_DN5985_c0_g1~~TRINITY_DN5985_c0_g1_i3.p1  ORF type:complete len:120 (-),score=31.88 TRINITY_DN5985_c0_g1_i3:210-524(-)
MEPEEKELAPGVFLIDFRQKKNTQPEATTPKFQTAEEYQFEIDRLTHSLFHLKRSNQELEEALKLEHDDEFVVAIEENKIIIEKYERQLVELKNAMEELTGAFI